MFSFLGACEVVDLHVCTVCVFLSGLSGHLGDYCTLFFFFFSPENWWLLHLSFWNSPVSSTDWGS